MHTIETREYKEYTVELSEDEVKARAAQLVREYLQRCIEALSLWPMDSEAYVENGFRIRDKNRQDEYLELEFKLYLSEAARRLAAEAFGVERVTGYAGPCGCHRWRVKAILDGPAQ